jgi:hypothetical protein
VFQTKGIAGPYSAAGIRALRVWRRRAGSDAVLVYSPDRLSNAPTRSR